MENSGKLRSAAKLAENLCTTEVSLSRDVRLVENKKTELSACMDTKDSLLVRLSFGFDIAHFAPLMAVTCAE